ncbi:protein MID1-COMPLEMENTING ACTIVITY 2-like [Actinidia eriantha]|uniref:protein MID1-COMPLEMENTING ACTIVITY 2-like n=1 Tax=Actinidia eriantha TaxID=165200 RepID=UPI00258B2A78|nr:protein MID1-COMPLEMENTING ACTIVITY 2-like [Actinidia eriantha]
MAAQCPPLQLLNVFIFNMYELMAELTFSSPLPIKERGCAESLQAIEEDHREYTLDEQDMEAQGVLLKKDRTKKDANILENSMSHRYYPELEFHEALQEKEKLQVELHRSQVKNDPKECQVIEHLIELTQNVVNVPTGKKLSLDVQTCAGSGYGMAIKSSLGANDLKPDNQVESEWQADLFDCYREPCLSLKACVYPCGIFSHIAHVGGACDDFLTHLMCCCCAMVQEWRELELRGFEGISSVHNLCIQLYEGQEMWVCKYKLQTVYVQAAVLVRTT